MKVSERSESDRTPPAGGLRDRSSVAIVLGSRSPRRLELLSAIVPRERLLVVPPLSPEELTFEDTTCDDTISGRLELLVARKYQSVLDRIRCEYPELVSQDAAPPTRPLVIVADTLVIATDSKGGRVVLGQPDQNSWRPQVRNWIRTLLSGRVHSVWTCFRVSRGDTAIQQIVRSEVTFSVLSDQMIEWYLNTGESPGKAGGYGIQGLGAALISGLRGSLTNVIGLPLWEVADALDRLLPPTARNSRGGEE